MFTCAAARCSGKLSAAQIRAKSHRKTGLCSKCYQTASTKGLPTGGFIPSSAINLIARKVLAKVQPTISEKAEATRMARGTRHPRGPWEQRPTIRMEMVAHGRAPRRLPHLLIGRRKEPSALSVISTEAQQNGITAAHDTGGVQVKQAGSMFTTEVHSADNLGDNDIVTVSGMQMTVRDARNMGMLESLFGKTAPSANEETPAVSTESAPEDEGATPQDLYAEAVGNLSEHQAAGTMPTEEVRSYELALGQVTMQGLDIEDAAEMYEAIDDGELDPNSVNDETRHLMKQAEAQVEQAAVASITRELGADGLAELTRYADASPAAWREMRRYAIARSMGTQGQTTWTDVLNVVRRSLR